MATAYLNLGAVHRFREQVENGNVEEVRQILNNTDGHIDINTPLVIAEGMQQTALQIAVNKKWEELVHLLVEKGADVNANPGTESALQIAVRREYHPLAEMLLQHGANPNAPACGPDGQTALHTALHNNDARTVELLLEKGADTRAEDSAGESVVSIARELGHDVLSAHMVKEHDARLEDPRPRRLIVCCDGTWMKNDTDQPLSNVARIALCFADCDRRDEKHFTQIVHYQSGVGTSSFGPLNWYEGAFAAGTVFPPSVSTTNKYLSLLAAISQDIRDAYGFICDNFSTPDDEIILIGFSRGAFTVRALASLISDVGVLKGAGRFCLSQVYDLWEKQVQTTPSGDKHLVPPGSSTETSEEISPLNFYVFGLEKHHITQRKVKIKACAVWDTVAAIGAKLPKWFQQMQSQKLKFVDSALSVNIENVFHALALDEKRSHFEPQLWGEHDVQNLTQCWFRGSHSDVGGGGTNSGLANLTLAWMMSKLEPFVVFNDYRVSQLAGHWRLVSRLLRESKDKFKDEAPAQHFRVHNSYTKRYWLAGSKLREPRAVNDHPKSKESVHFSVFLLDDDDPNIILQSGQLPAMDCERLDEGIERKILNAWRRVEGNADLCTGLDKMLGTDQTQTQTQTPADAAGAL